MDEHILPDLEPRYAGRLKTIRRYLQSELPIAHIDASQNFERDGIVFRLDLKPRDRRLIFLSDEFLTDFSENKMAELLRKWDVAKQLLRVPKEKALFVTTEGLYTDRL